MRTMGINLTGAKEQEWLRNDGSPSIRYSDLTTADERASEIFEQLVSHVADVLCELIVDDGGVVCGDPTALEPTAELVLSQFSGADDPPRIDELFTSADTPDDTRQTDQYLQRVAERVVKELPSIQLDRILSRELDDEARTGPSALSPGRGDFSE
jgi:hypothetical protein